MSPDKETDLNNQQTTCPLKSGIQENWTWNDLDKSSEVTLRGVDRSAAHFHPNWSTGTAGVRGNRPLNRGVHYWEVTVVRRLFGTSLMFGIASKKARIHADTFTNLLGEDENSWALSHKGVVWHRGRSRTFTESFVENQTTVIGVLFNGFEGTLSFYKDGQDLGVAFTGINNNQLLYPAISSTAAKTDMMLGIRVRAFDNLQDQCRIAIARCLELGKQGDADQLPVPNIIKRFINQILPMADDTGSQRNSMRREEKQTEIKEFDSSADETRFVETEV